MAARRKPAPFTAPAPSPETITAPSAPTLTLALESDHARLHYGSGDTAARVCQAMAAACMLVATAPAPYTGLVGAGDSAYGVTIVPCANPDHGDVWDQVFISLHTEYSRGERGTWCGNRHGGIHALSALFADDVKRAVRADDARRAALAARTTAA